MPAIIAHGDKKKALLAYKEELLLNLKHYDERIKNAGASLQNPNYFDDGESSDSDIELCIKETGPSITQLKSQESLLKTCLQATEELTGVEVLQSEVNVLMQQPELSGEPPVTEDGTWHEVTVECCVDLVPFAMMFYVHKGHRTFAPTSYRGLRVLPSKSAHEAELIKSVLPGLTRPSDAVEVLRSYAIAHRSRRSTLARLADKFGAALHMEPIASGGYLLKCANLLEVSWTLQNKWSPIAPFHHRMKFDLEYMDEAYIKTITAAHRQLSDPAVDTDERTLLLAKIISTCLSAAPESDDSRRHVDSEVMAPPKSLPKKGRPKSNDNTVENRKSTQKSAKRPNQDANNANTKKPKKSETQDVNNTGAKEKNNDAAKSEKEKVKNVANDRNSGKNDANGKNSGKNDASGKNSGKNVASAKVENEKSNVKNVTNNKKISKNVTADVDSTKNGVDDKNDNIELSNENVTKNSTKDKNKVQDKDAAKNLEKPKQKSADKGTKNVDKAKQKNTEKNDAESKNEGNNDVNKVANAKNLNDKDAKKNRVVTQKAYEVGSKDSGKNQNKKPEPKKTVSTKNIVANSEGDSVANKKKVAKEADNSEKVKNKNVINKDSKEINQNQDNPKNDKNNKKESTVSNIEKPKNANEKPTNVANAVTNNITKKPLVEKPNKPSKLLQNKNSDAKIFQTKPTISTNMKKVPKTSNTEKENKNGGEVKLSKIPQKKLTTPVKGVFKKMAVRMSPRNIQENPQRLVGKKVIQKPSSTGIPRLMTKLTPKVT